MSKSGLTETFGLLATDLPGIFMSVAAGMAAFGLIALPNLLFKVGFIHRHAQRPIDREA